jgi:MoaA/NifB/PqqE/SkfB family radical SAM enzyme
MRTLFYWISDKLFAVRFSGGEPTIYPHLEYLVKLAKAGGIERIAISTNGSASIDTYKRLLDCGVNDISVSLDACCAEDGDLMAGGVKGAWDKVVGNIRELSKLTYVTVGVVLTQQNLPKTGEIIRFAADLGVSDIRIIPAAQEGDRLQNVEVEQEHLNRFPILRYRISNIKQGLPVRGLLSGDSSRCGLVLDDMAVCGNKHYPCIIYLREGGKAIGEVGPDMRRQREKWWWEHDCQNDPICKKQCLDVCRFYNISHRDSHRGTGPEPL